MKKRLTVKDIEQLSDDQKQNLIALWMPEVYDVAVASICKDITTEEYENYEFVVGRIDIMNGRRILLHDIKSLISDPAEDDSDAQCESSRDNDSLSGKEDIDKEPEEDEDEYSEEDEEFDIDYNYSRPSSFMREECYPLLNIGQMLDILQRSNSAKSGFCMTAFSNDMSCEIGTDTIGIDRYEKGFNEAELCDVLWESVKALL